MSGADWREQLPAKVRVLQIIVGALFFGCLFFLFAAFLVGQNANQAAEQPVLTYISLAAAGMILLVWVVLPGIVVSQGRKNIHRTLPRAKQVSGDSNEEKDERENSLAEALVQLLQTKTIVACAMLEGGVFFLLVVYMIEHSVISLLAAGVLMILLIAQMPTSGRATAWIENQMRLVDEERSF
jgi:uncharacterized membrane protein